MTSVRRRTAGGLMIFESAWTLYMQFALTPTSCPANGCPGPQFVPAYSLVTVAIAVIISGDGILGMWGASFAYSVGAILSAVLLILLGYSAWVQYGFAFLQPETEQALVGAVLAGLALVTNIWATRGRGGIPEQANPMNLPVFG